MSGVTWAKFYWSDWESDPALRLCSYAAQGLWMRMLCIAAAHDPIGYVCVAGRALDETSLARMTGGSESEVRSLLAELDLNGVCSRDRNGRIYSRRMVRDARAFAQARKNGKMGGNPSLHKDKEISASVNPQVIPEDKPQKPEARLPKKKGDANASLVPGGDVSIWDDVFALAWDAYPKSGRDRSKSRSRLWPIWREAANLAGGPERLLGAVRRYVAEDKGHKGDCGAPAFDRWLKDGRWDHYLTGPAEVRVIQPFPDPDIRNAVISAKGEAWAASWLDPCSWEPERRVIVPRNGIAAQRLRSEVMRVLQARKASIQEQLPH
jgi:hypothetical protein